MQNKYCSNIEHNSALDHPQFQIHLQTEANILLYLTLHFANFNHIGDCPNFNVSNSTVTCIFSILVTGRLVHITTYILKTHSLVILQTDQLKDATSTSTCLLLGYS